MHFSIPLISLASLALAAPTPDTATPAAVAGSTRNVYLSICTSRGLLGSDTSTSVILYNGPATSRTSPADVGTVNDSRAVSWAGATRRARLDSGTFESKIEAGADALAKSQIAGTGNLGTEQFVCFKDGASTFRFDSGLLGLGTTTCKADYWCASIDI